MKNGAMKNSEVRGGPEILGRVFRFSVEVVRFCDRLDRQPGVGRVLMSQIVRSGTSVGANLEEAQAAQSRADFIAKVSIALKEARETHFRLRVLVALIWQRFALLRNWLLNRTKSVGFLEQLYLRPREPGFPPNFSFNIFNCSLPRD
jgi:hypothetical protein